MKTVTDAKQRLAAFFMPPSASRFSFAARIATWP
jgi:hypothetical protein